MTAARALAEWLIDLRVPAAVEADAGLRLLDVLAIAQAAVPLPIGQSVRRAAAALGQGDAATMIGGGRTTAALAALVNGTLAHALDFDDTHAASVMHPSAPAVAVALAMAEATDANGQRLLAGIAAGIEIGVRLGLVAPGAFHAAGQHPTGTLGTIAAAMVAAWFRGLDAAGIVAAAGIAGSQASGILEAYADGTWSKTLHPGWAAQAGIVAATLAAEGFTGPRSVLEGRYGVFRAHLPARTEFDFGAVTNELGTRWHAPDTAFKLYPNAHAIHAFIEGALVLRVPPAEVAYVLLDVPACFFGQIAEPCAQKRAPLTPTHARASLFYALAAALTDGGVTPAHFTAEAIIRPDLLALAARMEARPVELAGPIRFTGALTIHTHDGRALRHEVADANGTGPRRLSRGAIEAKARAVAPGAATERLIGLLDGLADVTNIGALVPQ